MWDATCVDTFCDSYRHLSTKEAGGAAGHADKEKSKRYAHLDQCYHFQPITFETCGAFGPETSCFLRDLGRRLKAATGEPNSFTYLLRLSVAIQVGNAASVLGSLPNSDFDIDLHVLILCYFCHPLLSVFTHQYNYHIHLFHFIIQWSPLNRISSGPTKIIPLTRIFHYPNSLMVCRI